MRKTFTVPSRGGDKYLELGELGELGKKVHIFALGQICVTELCELSEMCQLAVPRGTVMLISICDAERLQE